MRYIFLYYIFLSMLVVCFTLPLAGCDATIDEATCLPPRKTGEPLCSSTYTLEQCQELGSDAGCGSSKLIPNTCTHSVNEDGTMVTEEIDTLVCEFKNCDKDPCPGH